MSKIPLQLLQAFVTFSESKNINEAAHKLGLSQPGLSKQLKLLEELLPGKPFTLKGRKKALTNYGRELHRLLAHKLNGLEEVVGQAAAVHASPAEAVVRVVGRRGVLERASKVTFPGSLHFLEKNNEEAIGALMDMKADLGILHALPNTGELVARPLFREEFKLCLPKKKFPKRPDLNSALLARLRELPCLAYKAEDPMVHSIFSSHSVSEKGLRILRSTENYSTLAKMANEGLGWSILPSYLAEENSRCWALPIPPRALLAREFFLVYRAEMAGVVWFKDLLKEIKNCF